MAQVNIKTSNTKLNEFLNDRIKTDRHSAVTVQLLNVFVNNDDTDPSTLDKAADMEIHELFSITAAIEAEYPSGRNYLDIMTASFMTSLEVNEASPPSINLGSFREPKTILKAISFWTSYSPSVVSNLPIKDIEDNFKEEDSEYMLIAKNLVSTAKKQEKLFA